jgi:hypothetical protein
MDEEELRRRKREGWRMEKEGGDGGRYCMINYQILGKFDGGTQASGHH